MDFFLVRDYNVCTQYKKESSATIIQQLIQKNDREQAKKCLELRQICNYLGQSKNIALYNFAVKTINEK